MATIECKSAQPHVSSLWVEVGGITDDEVVQARARLDSLIQTERQVSSAVALALVNVVNMCPDANPSDLWQHVIYRHLIAQGRNDNWWKRVSGFALERAFVSIYEPRLAAHGLRVRIFDATEAAKFLASVGADTKPTKIDVFIEAESNGDWQVFGAAHVKASIAERIQDDVPASSIFMEKDLVSIAVTMDAKSYPPPHGDCTNYGELGGRSVNVSKDRIKRGYVEVNGQFDGLFSYNLRTPPSPRHTPSGKRIYTLSLSEPQPDQLVRFLMEKWADYSR